MQLNLSSFFEALTAFSSHNNIVTKDIKINDIFRIYLQMIKSQYEQGTIAFNICHLKILKRFLDSKNIQYLSQINQLTVEEFKFTTSNSGKSNSTTNKELQLLKRVMNYAKSLKLYDGDIFQYQKLREDTPETKYISIEELNIINHSIGSLKLQNQIIVLILISTGIRRSELTKILIKNIDFQNKTILLTQTKTHKHRYAYIHDDLIEGVSWLISKNKIYLFESDNNQQITPDSISSVLKRLGNKVGIKDLSSHKLRHSFATYLIKNNVNIREVQELMGHTNISTTMRYLHNDKESVKNSSINCNPLSLLKQKKH